MRDFKTLGIKYFVAEKKNRYNTLKDRGQYTTRDRIHKNLQERNFLKQIKEFVRMFLSAILEKTLKFSDIF